MLLNSNNLVNKSFKEIIDFILERNIHIITIQKLGKFYSNNSNINQFFLIK
jgi:hypothetical protein